MKKHLNGITYLVAFVIIIVISLVYKLFLNGSLDGLIFNSGESTQTSFVEGTTTIEETSSVMIQVSVTGEVNNPGVYSIAKGTILNDLINMSGGFTSNADQKKINLVYILYENVSIYIPAEGEAMVIGSGSPYMGESGDSENSGGLTNINTAGVDELCKLPGIGESMANRIVEYRKNKPFTRIEDIKNVSGIGDAKYSQICDLICV